MHDQLNEIIAFWIHEYFFLQKIGNSRLYLIRMYVLIELKRNNQIIINQLNQFAWFVYRILYVTLGSIWTKYNNLFQLNLDFN